MTVSECDSPTSMACRNRDENNLVGSGYKSHKTGNGFNCQKFGVVVAKVKEAILIFANFPGASTSFFMI